MEAATVMNGTSKHVAPARAKDGAAGKDRVLAAAKAALADGEKPTAKRIAKLAKVSVTYAANALTALRQNGDIPYARKPRGKVGKAAVKRLTPAAVMTSVSPKQAKAVDLTFRTQLETLRASLQAKLNACDAMLALVIETGA